MRYDISFRIYTDINTKSFELSSIFKPNATGESKLFQYMHHEIIDSSI